LVWRDFNGWQQIQVFGNVPHREILVYLAAAVELFGGIAIQFERSARLGAVVLGALYLFFALTWIPRIAAEPGIYDRWGNFFEQFSIVSGAIVVCASSNTSDTARAAKTALAGYYFFAICVISFTLAQLFYLPATASFVPKWIPPGQSFWAIATTVFFALAVIALFSGRLALLASRLLTAMLVGFGLLVWLPAPFADPHKIITWTGKAQNLAITGAAWVITDYLALNRSTTPNAQNLSVPLPCTRPFPVPLPATVSTSFSSLVTPRIVKSPSSSNVVGPVCTTRFDTNVISGFSSTKKKSLLLSFLSFIPLPVFTLCA
jgi:uncharacterized membrane protein YphA (DoxX/SURF4 family)